MNADVKMRKKRNNQGKSKKNEAEKKSDKSEGKKGEKAGNAKDQGNKKVVTCWNCGKEGHKSPDCPELADDDVEDGQEPPLAANTYATDGSGAIDKYCGICSSLGIKKYEVILDSGSQVNILHPDLLRNLRSTDSHGYKGSTGKEKKVEQVGYLEGFFDCLACKDVVVNVLSLADVEDIYNVTYQKGESYTVHMDDSDLVFVRRNKFYVADFSYWLKSSKNKYAMLGAEHMYTKKEVSRAIEAGEFIKNAGYPSRGEAIHLARDGNIMDMPQTAKDIDTYYNIYGDPVAAIRGKATEDKAPYKDTYDEGLVHETKVQELTCDIMHVGGRSYLLSVASPLELKIVSHLDANTERYMGEALEAQLKLLRSRNFDVNHVVADPQLACLSNKFPSVAIDTTGAGDHTGKVDVVMRRVKEMFRSVISGLPYTLPKNLTTSLVTYCVSRYNLKRSSGLADNVCPRVKFTGRKVDYKREFQLAFGDYCEVYLRPKHGEKNDAYRPRTEPCIALYPSANITGSWVFYNLNTKAYVRRSRWFKKTHEFDYFGYYSSNECSKNQD